MKILGVAPRVFFENTILQSEDTHWCGKFQKAVHWKEHCAENCERQSSCDTFAWADDEHKLLVGEAWECNICGFIVNAGEDCSGRYYDNEGLVINCTGVEADSAVWFTSVGCEAKA